MLSKHLLCNVRQHTSAFVSIRQHTSAYVSICQRTSAYVSICQHTSAYVSRMWELLLRSGRDTWSVTCAMLYLLYLRQQSCELAVRCAPPSSSHAGHLQQAHPQDALVCICTTCSCTGQRAACHSLLLQAHLHTSAYVIEYADVCLRMLAYAD